MEREVNNNLAIRTIDRYQDKNADISLELTVGREVIATVMIRDEETDEWDLLSECVYPLEDIDEAYDVFKEFVISHRDKMI